MFYSTKIAQMTFTEDLGVPSYVLLHKVSEFKLLCNGSIFPSLAMLFLLLLISISQFAQSRRRLRLPPGPAQWPIVGNLLDLGTLPHRDMHRMHDKYGPIVYLKLGSVDVVTTNDPEMIKDILVTQDNVFASRPQNTAATKHLCFDGQDLALAPYGPHWKAMRRICMEHLFTSRRILSFRTQRFEEAQCMTHEVWKHCKKGQLIDLRKVLAAFSTNCMTRMLFGKRCYDLSDSKKRNRSYELLQLIKDSSELMAAFYIGDYLPALRFLDLQGLENRMKETRKRLDEVFNEIMEECRQERHESGGKLSTTFIDVLLSLKEKGEEHINDTVIQALLEDLVAAGVDTSTTISEWAMVELLRHPEIMRKAQEEIDAIVGQERMVEEKDLSELHYVRCVTMETMRLRPAGPFVVPHEAMKATKVGGYDIPEKTQMLINAFSHSLNKKVWGEKAEEFWPERHMKETIKIENSAGRDVRYIIFSAGKRRCPGAQLGMTFVMLTIARLLHGFDWFPPIGMNRENIDVNEVFALTMPPATPLAAHAIPRLPASLYHCNQLS